MQITSLKYQKKIHSLGHRTWKFRPGLNVVATLEDYWLKVTPGEFLTIPLSPLKLDGMFLGASKTHITRIRPDIFKLMSPDTVQTTFDTLCDEMDRENGRANWDSGSIVLVFFYIEPELVAANGLPVALIEYMKGGRSKAAATPEKEHSCDKFDDLEDSIELESLRVRVAAYEWQKPKVTVACIKCGSPTRYDRRYGQYQECLECRPIEQRHPDANAQVYPALTADQFTEMLSKSGEASMAKGWFDAQKGTDNAG